MSLPGETSISRMLQECRELLGRIKAAERKCKWLTVGKTRRRRLDKLAARMYAEIRAGASLSSTASKYKRSPGTLYSLFETRGWPVLLDAEQRRAALGKSSRQRRASLDALVAQMHREHWEHGLGLSEVGRRHGRDGSTVRSLFDTRALPIRPDPRGSAPKLPNGCVAPLVPKTPAEIDALIAAATQLRLPRPLKQEWRRWPLARRAEFIRRLRRRLAAPTDRPETPCSPNVRPFDYGTPEAWEIVRRMNAGRDARTAAIKLNLCSQGMIWHGSLWFWSAKTGYERGPWTRDQGRPLLHHVIWEEAHGRRVPPRHVLTFLDGNINNLTPENLALQSRGDLCVDNRRLGRARKAATAGFFQMAAGAAALASQPA